MCYICDHINLDIANKPDRFDLHIGLWFNSKMGYANLIASFPAKFCPLCGGALKGDQDDQDKPDQITR